MALNVGAADDVKAAESQLPARGMAAYASLSFGTGDCSWTDAHVWAIKQVGRPATVFYSDSGWRCNDVTGPEDFNRIGTAIASTFTVRGDLSSAVLDASVPLRDRFSGEAGPTILLQITWTATGKARFDTGTAGSASYEGRVRDATSSFNAGFDGRALIGRLTDFEYPTLA